MTTGPRHQTHQAVYGDCRRNTLTDIGESASRAKFFRRNISEDGLILLITDASSISDAPAQSPIPAFLRPLEEWEYPLTRLYPT